MIIYKKHNELGQFNNTKMVIITIANFINFINSILYSSSKDITYSTGIHTSLRGNPLLLSYSGPRPCRGTERCHHWCSSEDHFQSGTESPEDQNKVHHQYSVRLDHINKALNGSNESPSWGPC